MIDQKQQLKDIGTSYLVSLFYLQCVLGIFDCFRTIPASFSSAVVLSLSREMRCKDAQTNPYNVFETTRTFHQNVPVL